MSELARFQENFPDIPAELIADHVFRQELIVLDAHQQRMNFMDSLGDATLQRDLTLEERAQFDALNQDELRARAELHRRRQEAASEQQ